MTESGGDKVFSLLQCMQNSACRLAARFSSSCRTSQPTTADVGPQRQRELPCSRTVRAVNGSGAPRPVWVTQGPAVLGAAAAAAEGGPC